MVLTQVKHGEKTQEDALGHPSALGRPTRCTKGASRCIRGMLVDAWTLLAQASYKLMMCKITMVESTSSYIKNYTQLFKFSFKI